MVHRKWLTDLTIYRLSVFEMHCAIPQDVISIEWFCQIYCSIAAVVYYYIFMRLNFTLRTLWYFELRCIAKHFSLVRSTCCYIKCIHTISSNEPRQSSTNHIPIVVCSGTQQCGNCRHSWMQTWKPHSYNIWLFVFKRQAIIKKIK